jgi:hypothetical protein
MDTDKYQTEPSVRILDTTGCLCSVVMRGDVLASCDIVNAGVTTIGNITECIAYWNDNLHSGAGRVLAMVRTKMGPKLLLADGWLVDLGSVDTFELPPELAVG